ncbi:MAG: OmpA family protein [Verrucomicrobia bacterium]|nr:OmpA family protein [Verrucomicrobiota bacterium]
MAKKHAHHGGAWKVAYADFTTAMMALFLVLWLTAQDSKIKEAIERAFRNPFASLTKESMGIVPNKDVQATHQQRGNFESVSAMEMELLRRITEDLAKLFKQNDDEDAKSVKFDLTPDGLRISVFDFANRPIFKPDSAEFTEYGSWVFSTLAWEISRYTTFRLELEGHTEAGRPMLRPDYGSWELSADRANAARRLLTEHGVQSDQLHRVAGYGDTQPMEAAQPKAPSNRRVAVLLRKKLEQQTS